MPQPNTQKAKWTKWVQTLRRSRSGTHPGLLLPSFFVIGLPRTGTSWLYQILKERTVLPSLIKETRFFDAHFQRVIDWYSAHFESPNGNRCMGEIAPTYFASREAPRRIKELVPNAKIVCTFRHPVERILSLYRVRRAYGIIPWSFEEAILRDPELTETSKYATYLKSWQQEFGVDRVLPTLYDDLRDSPQDFVDKLADFIGVPRFRLSCDEMGSVPASEAMTHPCSYYCTRSATLLAEWLKVRHFGRLVTTIRSSPISKLLLEGGRAFAGLSSEAALTIQELFRSEVEELELLLERDLSAWKPLRVDLPSLSPTELDDESADAA